MKKKILLMLLLGGMTLMPTSMMAKSDYGWDDNAEPVIWRTPAHNPYVYITYDESNGTVLVTFNSAVDNAEILVNLNGEEVDYQLKFPTPVFIMFQSNNGCCNPSVFRRFLFVKNTLIPALLLIQVLPRLGVC